MDQHDDDYFENAQKATDQGRFLKLPRYQKNLNYGFGGIYSYSTKIAHSTCLVGHLSSLVSGPQPAPPPSTTPGASWKITMGLRR